MKVIEKCPNCGSTEKKDTGVNWSVAPHSTCLTCGHAYRKYQTRDEFIGSIKWSRKEEQGTAYRREFPDRHYYRIVTKKAKFFGKLMYAVLVAGGGPGRFRPYNLRNVPLEHILDSLMPNNVEFSITYTGDKQIEKCPKCGSKDMEVHSVMDESKIVVTANFPWCECLNCWEHFPKYIRQRQL